MSTSEGSNIMKTMKINNYETRNYKVIRIFSLNDNYLVSIIKVKISFF